MRKGYLSLLLHAHLPFVRHPEYPEFLEEDWLYEAITETYVPLWQVFEGLVRDGVPFRMTMSLTPPLCAMLNDELLRTRYLRYLDRAIALARREIDRTQSQPEINHLARKPRGIWLPECAYFSGLERYLQESELRWFCLDAHGLMFGNPRPRYAIFAPVFTAAGPAAFGRDRESSKQVWSAQEGYPGDPAYRDFYRDVGHDLDLDYLRPFLPPVGSRRFTGIKYHRITGHTPNKEIYVPGWAQGAADYHAGDFMVSRTKQIEHLVQVTNIEPIVLSPFDAELFGHWWYEGPMFLNFFIRKAVYDQKVFELTTPSAYLEKYDTLQILSPSPSSWGHKGFWEVWLDETNSWIYPHLHAAARRMTESARAVQKKPATWKERVIRQMARELLLGQSSDWAFLMKTGTAREYAAKRTEDHILCFTRLYDQLVSGTVDEAFLQNCEWRDNLFPDLNWQYCV